LIWVNQLRSVSDPPAQCAWSTDRRLHAVAAALGLVMKPDRGDR
jgi:hypothetical protein